MTASPPSFRACLTISCSTSCYLCDSKAGTPGPHEQALDMTWRTQTSRQWRLAPAGVDRVPAAQSAHIQLKTFQHFLNKGLIHEVHAAPQSSIGGLLSQQSWHWLQVDANEVAYGGNNQSVMLGSSMRWQGGASSLPHYSSPHRLPLHPPPTPHLHLPQLLHSPQLLHQ